MNGLIYGYKIKENQKVVYVGQTTNEIYRRYRHEEYDPYKEDILEYNYPLSRGIRKHGIDYYEYFVIEKDLDEIDLIEREEFFISFYDTYKNGYNQTPGGKAPKYILFEKDIILLAKQMIKDKINFNKISEITGISIPHLSSINTGNRHYDSQESYPLCPTTCGRKLVKEQVLQIINLLKDTNLSYDKIGKQFNITGSSIRNINVGARYKNDDIVYPIRPLKK